MQISDPQTRKAATGALMHEWRQSDPQAANAWLKEQGIPDPDL
jgi:hypothetical protein